MLRILSNRQKGNWNLKLESFKSNLKYALFSVIKMKSFIQKDILMYYKKNINKVDWVIVKELACISE